MTVAEFRALWQRRESAFKRECYVAGIVAASCFNSQRTDWKQHVFSPMEFVPRSPEENQHDEIILMLRDELSTLQREHYPLARERWFKTLTENKVPDVEQILLEVFSAYGG
jgi:hypothetical protein